jgi:hypothetical protein
MQPLDGAVDHLVLHYVKGFLPELGDTNCNRVSIHRLRREQNPSQHGFFSLLLGG